MFRSAGVSVWLWLLLCAPAVASASTIGSVIRAEDQRVAEVAFRLAVRGVSRCVRTVPNLGLVLHHLGQYQPRDRPTVIAQFNLDRGPGVLVVVPNSPAARAGLLPGDVVLAVDGSVIPAEPFTAESFVQQRARLRTDAISDLLDAAAADEAVDLSVLRRELEVVVRLAPAPACPSRVHLARSEQLNAFADGTHVLLTTRLLSLAKTDDELAFVIAHEMAHNILGHPAEIRKMKRETKGVEVLLARPAFTRRTEREADRLAADLVLDSGYSLDGAGRVLHALDTGFTGLSFLANHDKTSDRVGLLRAHEASRRGEVGQ